jgi:hypothetical protein
MDPKRPAVAAPAAANKRSRAAAPTPPSPASVASSSSSTDGTDTDPETETPPATGSREQSDGSAHSDSSGYLPTAALVDPDAQNWTDTRTQWLVRRCSTTA